MGGGLMQLVAYGAQDVYLTGNPQITFFKVVFRRHTNFSMESIRQVWMGGDEKNGHMSSTISRNGDLVNGLHLQLDIQIVGTIANPGYTVIDNVECEIGGQMIDRQSGEWMEIYSELTEPSNRLTDLTPREDNLCMELNKFQMMSGCGGVYWGSVVKQARWHVPLRFWFCRNPGLALPLIALQYHEVKINLSFKDDLSSSPVLTNKLYADYIYLDTDERRRFAQVSHEYLIEQVQMREYCGVKSTMDLDFNHPVKELVWCLKRDPKLGTATHLPGFSDFKRYGQLAEQTYQIKLNGHDRFSERPLEYFTRYQIWRHHTGGQLGIESEDAYGESVAVYSFALKPEEHQPSGTCNFSRIDNAQLLINNNGTSGGDNINVYAINYNVLRIMSGMGGLAYSN
jgi:hypothetical protein